MQTRPTCVSPLDWWAKEGARDASRAFLCKLNQPQVTKLLLVYHYVGARLSTNNIGFYQKQQKRCEFKMDPTLLGPVSAKLSPQRVTIVF